MRLVLFTLAFIALSAQAQQRPLFQTTKVDGTDNVYVFRYGGHQSMFVVTNDGVIATDPISYGRPQAAVTYIEEIKKVTDKPIKYLIYSHHHYDHIAGGQPFKDAGAKIVAHKRTKERLAQLKDPHTVLPDETFDKKKTITLGGTTVEMIYMGLNHSDATAVIRLPKEKIIFTVDTVPAGQFPGRGMIDSYPLEWEDFLQKLYVMDWERLIPGHPGVGGRLGTKKDMEQQLAFMTDLNAEVKKASDAGKCFDPAVKDVRLPQYGTLANYEQNIEWVIHRYCGYWGRGI
jgi:glyoxylase-like metal-dependent hydrolase (beta-lactamase superfamily II)